MHTDPPEGFPAVLEAGRVFDLLLSLVDKSLVLYDEDDAGRGRYRLLETMRQYAGDRAREAGDGDAAGACHVESMLRLAVKAEAGLQGAEQARWLRPLDAEHDNRRAALDRCARRPELAESGLRIASALQIFWDVRGALSEGRRWLEGALAGSHGNTGARGAAALAALGALAGNQGEFALARWCLEESLRIRRVLGNTSGIVASLGNLGIVLYGRGDYAGARARFEEALAIKRAEGGEPYAVALLLGNLGVLAPEQGDAAAARGFYEESLGLLRAAGNPRATANVLSNLGTLAQDAKDYGAARGLYEESLQIRRELADHPGMAISLINLGLAATLQGRFADARRHVDAALALLLPVEDRRLIAYALEAAAALTAAERRPLPAARLWGAAEALREALGSPLPPNEREEYDRQVAAARAWPAGTRSPRHPGKGGRCRLSRRSRWRGAVRNRVNKPAHLLKRLNKHRVESAEKTP